MSGALDWLADWAVSPLVGLQQWLVGTSDLPDLEPALSDLPQTPPVESPGSPAGGVEIVEVDLEPAGEQTALVPLGLTLPTPGVFTFVDLDPLFVHQLLIARHIDTLDRLCPPFLHQYLRLPELASDRDWTPSARATRALRAGVSAARVLAGQFDKQVRSLRLRGPNRHYIVLKCRQFPGGFYTQDFSIYSTYLRVAGGSLQRGSVSHAFETAAEVEIFLRGAHRQWPVELHGSN